jgi:6-phosphogluconolactonase
MTIQMIAVITTYGIAQLGFRTDFRNISLWEPLDKGDVSIQIVLSSMFCLNCALILSTTIMKFAPLFLIILLFSCSTEKSEETATMRSQPFFVGTYTDGESQGIYQYALNEDGSLKKIKLLVKSEMPSFLAKSQDNRFLFAVNETNHNQQGGTIESYKIQEDSLILINRSPSGGAHPCFVTSNEDGYVLVANYTGGNIGLLKHGKDGKLTGLLDIQQHTGQGTTDRQQAPHAHSSWFEPSGDGIISVDLGTNELWFSQLDLTNQKLVSAAQGKLAMAPGAGPRHLTFHPNGRWIYVVNELDGSVALVEKTNNGAYTLGATISTLPNDFTEPNSCADIHISSDGKFVYASNRGHNSIVIFSVDERIGSLSVVAHESTRGDGPRNFTLSPDEDFLLVANQRTNNIISFRRDREKGTLEFVDEIEAPTPVCLLF